MDQFSYLHTMPHSPSFPSSSSSSLFISPPQLAEDHDDQWTFEENKSFEDAFVKFDLVPPTPPFPSSSSSSALFISQPQLAEHHGEQWTFEDNKRFENALAEFDLGSPDLCENIQSRVPGKTLLQIKKHLDDLFEDIDNIEKGIIPIPDYKTTPTQVKSNFKSKPRKKGVTWTEEEHKLFLQGLEKYGKGDWKSISRHYVVSRNPTQVASHAQKYFLRLQNSAESEQSAYGGGRDESTGFQNHAEVVQVEDRRKYKKRSKTQEQNVPQLK